MPKNDPLPLSEAMRFPIVALHIFDPASVALAAAREHGVHHFPVFDRSHLVGVVCTCDLQEATQKQPVGDLMRPPVTIRDSGFATDAARLMLAADVGSVIVMGSDGTPRVIVTRSDLDGEPRAAALLEDCRCEACGSMRHLRRYQQRRLCFSCRERAMEPQAFETGGGD
jgi:signal-transduction protein with cAMP-binding, CBS, and nucleotidyltransferase domain